MTHNVSTLTSCTHSCCTILSKKSGAVREWDILLLVPQVLLLIFFSIKKFFKRSATNANSNNSVLEIYKRLIWWTVLISTVRAILSMVLSSFSTIIGLVSFFAFLDKVLWCLMTGTLWLCELMVLDFGLSLNLNRLLIRVISMIVLVQLVLEMVINDIRYSTGNPDDDKIAFEHGHSVFWLSTSLIMCFFYTIVILMTRFQKMNDFLMNNFRLTIPTRPSFYVYCGTMALIYWIMTVGAFFMVFGNLPTGFCLTDIASYIYYSFYALLLHRLLLSSVLRGENEDDAAIQNMGEAGRARYRPLIDDGSDDELLNLGDQF